MASQTERLSIPEYLEFERASEIRHEYFEGLLTTREGLPLNHNFLNLNIAVALHDQLRDLGCVTMSSNMRVRVPGTAFYCYPDTLAVCGAVEVEDEHEDTLLNPCVIVEIYSPETEAFDRGVKWAQYQDLPTLRDYLLIAQDRVCVEHFARQSDDSWLLHTYKNRSDTLTLTVVPRALNLGDIYERVTFDSKHF